MSKTTASAPAPAKGFDATKYVKKGLDADTVGKLKEVFDVFDYDGSGNVSTEELINTIRALNLEAQAGQILAIVNNSGHQGEIDFGAFLGIFGFGGDSSSETTLQSIFEAFDTTGSGAFGPEDFEKVAASVGEHFSSAEVDQIVDYADKDRDGAISFDEFVSVVTKVYPKV
jgi:Ca2+-binding EF-hand superfamily protein